MHNTYCTGMRIEAEVRNQYAFIYFYLLNFICIISEKYNFDFNMYVALVLWTSHSYPPYSGGKVGLKCWD